MLSVFTDVKSLLKIGGISIDNWVFKLHYKLTVVILLVFSILVNSRQYFGDPIDCTIPDTEIKNYVDTYCWFNSFSLVDDKGYVFLQVKKYQEILATEKKYEKIRGGKSKEYSGDHTHYQQVKQTFYQWIGVVLLLQAGLFYLPRFIWKNIFEEGRVKELVNGLQSHTDDSELLKRQEKIVEYIKYNKGHHLFYALKFFTCEVLNFVNVISQIFLTDFFLGHAFLNYGLQWLWYDYNDDEHQIFHPSHRYFPRETLCKVSFGSATAAENNVYNARCILPIQIFNEKIYLFLWFYFIALAAISGIMLIYRLIVILFPNVRYFLFVRRAWATDEKILRTIVYDFDIGDWFLIYQMMKNLDPFVFGRLMKTIYEGVGSPRSLNIRGGEDSQDELLGVFAHSVAPYDIDEKHEKLNNQGKGYFAKK